MLSRPTLFKNSTTDTLITRCGVLQRLAVYFPVQTFFPPPRLCGMNRLIGVNF